MPSIQTASIHKRRTKVRKNNIGWAKILLLVNPENQNPKFPSAIPQITQKNILGSFQRGLKEVSSLESSSFSHTTTLYFFRDAADLRRQCEPEVCAGDDLRLALDHALELQLLRRRQLVVRLHRELPDLPHVRAVHVGDRLIGVDKVTGGYRDEKDRSQEKRKTIMPLRHCLWFFHSGVGLRPTRMGVKDKFYLHPMVFFIYPISHISWFSLYILYHTHLIFTPILFNRMYKENHGVQIEFLKVKWI